MSELATPLKLIFLVAEVNRLFRQAFDKAVEASGFELTQGATWVLVCVAVRDGLRSTQRIVGRVAASAVASASRSSLLWTFM